MTDDNLTINQNKALEVLIATGNVSQAADAAGVSRQTIYTWKQDDTNFNSALNQASMAITEEASQRLMNLAEKALIVLEKTLDDPNTPAYGRIRAADLILSKVLQLRESFLLENKVSELEKRLDVIQYAN